MKSVIGFIRATVVGGVVFLVPVVVIAVIIAKALEYSMVVAAPMAGFVPIDSVGGIAIANIVGLVAIAFTCLAAGLIARSSVASDLVHHVENQVLWKMPGYAFLKGVTDSIGDSDKSSTLSPVLAALDDAAQIGFEVERTADGRVVVYLPGAPDPWAGSILILEESRVSPVAASMVEVVQSVRALGRGTGQLVGRS